MNSSELTPRKPLRLWPGVAAVVLQWLFWYVVPVAVRDSGMAGMIGAAVCALVILVWWLFFSRARWSERVGAIVLMIAAVFATKRLVDPSIAGGGMGMLLYIAVIPGLCLALVAWAVATRRFSDGARRASRRDLRRGGLGRGRRCIARCGRARRRRACDFPRGGARGCRRRLRRRSGARAARSRAGGARRCACELHRHGCRLDEGGRLRGRGHRPAIRGRTPDLRR